MVTKFQKEMKFELRLKLRFIANGEANGRQPSNDNSCLKVMYSHPIAYYPIQRYNIGNQLPLKCIRISSRNDRRTVSNLFSNRG